MSIAPSPPLAPHLDGVARLDHLGVITATGDDAIAFLQGQLTQDVSLMPAHEARLAGYCSAKGRLLASFTVFRHGSHGLRLVCRQDILAPTLKRLRMFVLRAKVQLTDDSAQVAVYGLAGATLTALRARLGATHTRHDDGPATLLMLPPASEVPRALWLTDPAAPAPEGPALTPDRWAWAEVRSGVAPVSAATVEAFVPQMLNHESVGGVNFKKGCYPGQEVVARSQFRGTLKRRAYLLHTEAPTQAGQEVFAATDPSQPCGTVALAAPSPLGGFDAIASLQTAAADAGALHLGAAEGPALQRLPLPYALLDDI